MKDAREDAPSKTRRKLEAASLQSLGEQLAQLPGEVLDALQLPERLREALDTLGRITSHGALRRQRQFIGRLMREMDPAPLRAAVEAHQRPSREAARVFREAEDWRDRLLAGGAETLGVFLRNHPKADSDSFSTTLAAAREGRKGAARSLFRLIRTELDRAARDPGSPAGESLLE